MLRLATPRCGSMGAVRQDKREGGRVTQFVGEFPAPAWTPPAREPFVPLRPLTLGHVLAAAFRALRHNPAVTLVPAIAFSLVAGAGGTLFGLFVVDPLIHQSGSSVDGFAFYTWVSGFGAGALGWLVIRALAFAAGTLQQGVSSMDVTHAIVGRRLTPGGMRRRTRGVRAPLIIWTAFVVVGVMGAGLLAIVLLGALAVASPVMSAVGPMLGIPAGAVLVAWLGTRLAFVPSVLVVERLQLGAAVRRAWRLTRRQFWRTLGTRMLCWTMVWIATMLVALPVQLIISWFASIVAGNGDVTDYLTTQRIGEAVAAVVTSVIGAIGLVVTTSTDALLYVDARMRHEGLDLELARFMETRRPSTRFSPGETNPFAPPADVDPAAVRSETAPTKDAGWG